MARHCAMMSVLFYAACAGSDTCDTCSNIDTLRLERDEWTCVDMSAHPEYQWPPVCARTNRFLPGVFHLKNETIGDVQRFALHPTRSYDDAGLLKYRFQMHALHCEGAKVSASIRVFSENEHSFSTAVMEIVVLLVLILSMLLCCACADSSSSDMLLVSFLFEKPSLAHFE